MSPLAEFPSLQLLVMRIPAVLMAFTFHEFGHAWFATMFGDPGPKRDGRLTLSPMAHLDWLGLLLLFIAGFGWAKPVYVDVGRLRPRVLGDIAVSLAGVLMNLVLAVLFYIALLISQQGLPFGYRNPVLTETLWQVVFINIMLIAFNLIPLPPLDGFRVVRYLLPPSMDGLVATLYRFSPMVLLFLFVTGSYRFFLVPVARAVLNGIEYLITPFFF